MIFHKHKAIFFHVGKTAGTSIEEMLMPKHGMDPYESNRELMFGMDKELNIYLHHASCKTIKNIVSPTIFNDYFKFSVVRNPFTRMVSTYYYTLDYHKKYFGEFRDFILALPELSTRANVLAGSHYISQTHYTHINGQKIMDYIGKFENLASVVENLNQKLNIECSLPKINIRKQTERPKDINELYDDETFSIIQSVYKDDFVTYGYDINALPIKRT